MSAEVLVLAATLASSATCSTLAVLYHLGVGDRYFAAVQARLDARRRAAVYHRHRWQHRRCHARPTLAHRARIALARARTVRLRAADPALTTTRPDITARTA